MVMFTRITFNLSVLEVHNSICRKFSGWKISWILQSPLARCQKKSDLRLVDQSKSTGIAQEGKTTIWNPYVYQKRVSNKLRYFIMTLEWTMDFGTDFLLSDVRSEQDGIIFVWLTCLSNVYNTVRGTAPPSSLLWICLSVIKLILD